jgi:hypothetical protein
MMKCSACGAALAPDARQCKYCGAAMPDDPNRQPTEEELLGKVRLARRLLDEMMPAPTRFLGRALFYIVPIIVVIFLIGFIVQLFSKW